MPVGVNGLWLDSSRLCVPSRRNVYVIGRDRLFSLRDAWLCVGRQSRAIFSTGCHGTTALFRAGLWSLLCLDSKPILLLGLCLHYLSPSRLQWSCFDFGSFSLQHTVSERVSGHIKWKLAICLLLQRIYCQAYRFGYRRIAFLGHSR